MFILKMGNFWIKKFGSNSNYFTKNCYLLLHTRAEIFEGFSSKSKFCRFFGKCINLKDHLTFQSLNIAVTEHTTRMCSKNWSSKKRTVANVKIIMKTENFKIRLRQRTLLFLSKSKIFFFVHPSKKRVKFHRLREFRKLSPPYLKKFEIFTRIRQQAIKEHQSS